MKNHKHSKIVDFNCHYLEEISCFIIKYCISKRKITLNFNLYNFILIFESIKII